MKQVQVFLPLKNASEYQDFGKIEWIDRRLIFDKNPKNYALTQNRLLISFLKNGSVVTTEYIVKEISVRKRLKLPRIIIL